MQNPLILVADDDPELLSVIALRLEDMGFRVRVACDLEELKDRLAEAEPILLLLDLQFGEHDGVEVLRQVKRLHPNLCVAMFTAYASIESAVASMRKGAFDYLTKPVDIERLRSVIGHAVNDYVQRKRLQSLEKQLLAREGAQPVMGLSPGMQRIQRIVESIANKDVTTLILGESGTGKEVFARQLHCRSDRREKPFVAVNMAALPRELTESLLFGHERGAFTGANVQQKGYFESADEGTVFLDEIGEMDLTLQAKLLRFLQERVVHRIGAQSPINLDVRVIAATNRDLSLRVQQGLFREDLYYRLNVVPLVIPPLRERIQDVPELANHFLDRAIVDYHTGLMRFSDDAMAALQAFDWPGNVRELRNVIERIVILKTTGSVIERADLPDEVLRTCSSGPEELLRNALPAKDAAQDEAVEHAEPGNDDLSPIQQMEKKAILDALQRSNLHVKQAAEMLGLGQATVYRKIKRYGIQLS